ncbi:MAG TPA: hypothetical protein EYP63_00220 [Desulfotomaculum sp.]|nr:hypothetical protein [Desulfotomaculum sp.]
MEHDNRAYGSNTRLLELNKYFTRLVNKSTKCRYPKNPCFFSTVPIGTLGAFNVIDAFSVGSLEFLVLDSHGGHIPGQVFFVNKEHGLCFSADYLINTGSLSAEEKNNLSLARYLMTSTNTNSQVFREEMAALKDVIEAMDRELKRQGKRAVVFPGHGDYYRL